MNKTPLSLEEAYEAIEANWIDFERATQVGSVFQRIRDQERERGNEASAHKAQLELEAFSFGLHEGGVRPQFEATQKDGSRFIFPDIQSYSANDIEYLKERLRTSQNPCCKMRYAQLLWSSKAKHASFAVQAIDNGFDALTIHLSEIQNQPESAQITRAEEIAKNLYFLAAAVKHRDSEVAPKILDLIRSVPDQALGASALRGRLLDFVLANPKAFPASIYGDLDELCFRWANEVPDPHGAITLFGCGERLSQRKGAVGRNWQFEVGRRFDQLLEWAEKPKILRRVISAFLPSMLTRRRAKSIV